jgi:acid phosphatase type 7
LVLCTVAAPASATQRLAGAVGDISRDPENNGSGDYSHQANVADNVIAFNPIKFFLLGDTQYGTGEGGDYDCAITSETEGSGCGAFDNNEDTGDTPFGSIDDSDTDFLEAIGNHEYYQSSTNDTASSSTCCDEGEGFRDYFNRDVSGTFPENPINYTGVFNTDTSGATAQDTRFYVIDSMVCKTYSSRCADVVGTESDGVMYDEVQALIADNSKTDCSVAVWHHPLFSNDTHHSGIESTMHDIYKLLDDQAGVDLILVGHSHSYEKFRRQDADNNSSSEAPRVFVVGTGGNAVNGFDGSPYEYHGSWTGTNDSNNAQIANTYGHLNLWFDSTGSYRAAFVNESGTTLDPSTGTNELYQCSNPLPA